MHWKGFEGNGQRQTWGTTWKDYEKPFKSWQDSWRQGRLIPDARRTNFKGQALQSLYDIKWSLERATRIKWWSNSFCIQHVRYIFWLWCKTLKKRRRKRHSSEITFNVMFVEGNSILFSIPDKGMTLWFKLTELLTSERRKWALERSENWQKRQCTRNVHETIVAVEKQCLTYFCVCVCACARACVSACQRVALII
jgi:hypothetical protein